MGKHRVKRTAEHKAKIATALRAHKRTPEHSANAIAALKARGWGGRKHGYASRMAKTPTWISWACMSDRCLNPNATHYERYGGRGIIRCSAWEKFSRFLLDMGERPLGMTLDRIDNDGNYEPGNCRWATVAVQNANRFYSTACSDGCKCKRHRGKVFKR